MATKFLDSEGLLYLWQKIKNTFVPSTRTVNGKALSADVTLSASDVGAVATQSGKGLSTNDYTTTEKNKLAGIATGAEVNVQADWNVTDTASDAYIKNKPTIPSGVEKSTTTPKMDGTASVGSETKFASGDHVHPSDTSRVPTTRKVNGFPLASDVLVINKLTDVASGGVTLRTNFNNENNEIETYDIYNTTAVIGLLNNANTIIAQTFVPNTAKGAASGVCPLDANSKVDSQYLPSYVDDVIEAYPVSGATALSAGWLSATSGGSALTPEAGKIYVLMTDSGDYSANTQFRWGGTAYVKLNDGGVSSITNAEIDTIVAS